MSKIPMQPLELIEGVIRFKENKLVRYLLDNGGLTLNNLAVIDFPNEDQEQFAQLIGYSLSGYSELYYVSDESIEQAEKQSKRMLPGGRTLPDKVNTELVSDTVSGGNIYITCEGPTIVNIQSNQDDESGG